ncbi:MAG: DNA mismatch repair protein MutS, partial [Clostridiales bacterium]|nr:DNA mismatch repair protein MutS [Clostridiales bacterium]
MQLSPMMQQYMEIKNRHTDCVLFFRLGDFYEMFFEDAILVSKELELTLTGKNYGQEERAPMCGVPFHSAETYIAKLIEKGYKVAVCEQIEDPATAKGLVKRDVVQIVTPGTLISQSMLNEKENNYLVSVYDSPSETGIAYCDISTGELYVTQIVSQSGADVIVNELAKVKAREILINENASEIEYQGAYFNTLDENYYVLKTAEDAILRQFHIRSLEGVGLYEKNAAILALGALLSYLYETQKQNLNHISNINYYDISGHMSLDKATIKNLELTETLFEKKLQGSLLGILDKT